VAPMDGTSWLEHLTPDECWQLLSATPVGRIGVLHDSAPEIYPVNHLVDRGTIVFRTDPGTKLRGLLRSPAVCYEADGIDAQAAMGWSVLVKGRAEQLSDPDDLDRVARLPLRLWSLGDKAHWIRIVPEDVTGRRIGRYTPAHDSPRATPAKDE
jgi:nitroimidazol reductase NimA-like FMN-containing flavoprotein (pyridoxamine 5'-phosphate oxidase superfamily)